MVSPSLKEPLESRASWRFFGSPDGLFAHAPRLGPEGPFLGGSGWVEESVLGFDCHGHVLRGCSRRSFPCGGTPIHPFVNPPACCGSRPGRLGPDTEYSIATVSRTQAVSIRITLGNWAESTGTLRLALRPRGPLLRQEGGPMQPSLTSLPIPLVVRGCSLRPVSARKAARSFFESLPSLDPRDLDARPPA